MTSSYLLFRLSGRVFGLKLSGAKEIFAWRKPRPVPLSYSFIEGLIDYRGTIYPVVNAVQRLSLRQPGPIGFTAREPAPAARPKGSSIILLEDKNVRFGIVVDGILNMAPLDDPAETPKKMDGIDTKFVKGIIKMEEHDVIILDYERLIHAG